MLKSLNRHANNLFYLISTNNVEISKLPSKQSSPKQLFWSILDFYFERLRRFMQLQCFPFKPCSVQCVVNTLKSKFDRFMQLQCFPFKPCSVQYVVNTLKTKFDRFIQLQCFPFKPCSVQYVVNTLKPKLDRFIQLQCFSFKPCLIQYVVNTLKTKCGRAHFQLVASRWVAGCRQSTRSIEIASTPVPFASAR